jgi:hypothetical protein
VSREVGFTTEIDRRTLEGRQMSPTTAWSQHDQDQALAEGFNSVAEWGVFHAVERLKELEARVKALEDAHPWTEPKKAIEE